MKCRKNYADFWNLNTDIDSTKSVNKHECHLLIFRQRCYHVRDCLNYVHEKGIEFICTLHDFKIPLRLINVKLSFNTWGENLLLLLFSFTCNSYFS